MKEEKVPKRYKCTECGFISSGHKTVDFGAIGFAVCFKCRGRLIEREEWLSWHNKKMREWHESLSQKEMEK